MVKPSVKYTLVAVVVGLLVGYIILGQSCGMKPTTSENFGTFNETSYLEANPDVAKAINSGRFSGSALDHWNTCGKNEGRKGSGVTTDTWLPTYEILTIVLIIFGTLIGLILIVAFGAYVYRRYIAPAAYSSSPYGARRH